MLQIIKYFPAARFLYGFFELRPKVGTEFFGSLFGPQANVPRITVKRFVPWRAGIKIFQASSLTLVIGKAGDQPRQSAAATACTRRRLHGFALVEKQHTLISTTSLTMIFVDRHIRFSPITGIAVVL
jgi:hypothetical protein